VDRLAGRTEMEGRRAVELGGLPLSIESYRIVSEEGKEKERLKEYCTLFYKFISFCLENRVSWQVQGFKSQKKIHQWAVDLSGF
jgi:hypothetical protein